MQRHCKIAEKGLIFMIRDMNSALANIRLSADLLDPLTESNQKGKEYYDVIVANILRLQETINTVCNSFTRDGLSVFMDDGSEAPEDSVK